MSINALGVVAPDAKLIRADSVAKLTAAVTPSSLFSPFSIEAAHALHDIPVRLKSTCTPESLVAAITDSLALKIVNCTST
ncbi:unannotated protein [freshwater metagenome]|uniref:Unannotated protein n=1 Tax=freshwater metagenome TaxID=449393 RepID=A0A6J7U6L1_9ZZZZ